MDSLGSVLTLQGPYVILENKAELFFCLEVERFNDSPVRNRRKDEKTLCPSPSLTKTFNHPVRAKVVCNESITMGGPNLEVFKVRLLPCPGASID
jgi:hypothetical protein